jgi:membrane protease YdiL (CAAX protease family)
MDDQPVAPNPPAIIPPDGSVQPASGELTNQAISHPQPAFHKVFLRPNGELRAGWRLLIFIVIFIVFAKLMNLGVKATGYKVPKDPVFTPSFITIGRIFTFLLVLVPTFIMSRIERKPLGVYGLPARGAFGKKFWEGALWGFGSLSVLLLLLRASGAFYFGSFALSPRDALYYAFAWGVAFLMVGLFEEYLFRGYVQYTLADGIGFWPACIALSLLFAWAHKSNPGETWLGLVDVFLAGIVLGAMLLRTGNLWFPVGFHLAWDWAESYFYGVADSGMQASGALLHPSIPTNRPWWLTGGTVGPEGSIFSCITEILLIVFILWRFRENRYPLQSKPALVTAA